MTMMSTVAGCEIEEAFKGAMTVSSLVIFGEATVTMPLRPAPGAA
jgi:hypothetical protein